jgi:prepilin signal peptidase PulO-like enzyme (type II secretory pathway)
MSDLFYTIYGTTLAGVFGLLVGSFLNVCVFRLPHHETIVRGHSYCPHCRHPLSGLDLIPVFSYLFLRGRCRYCQQPISSRYMMVEIITALFFALTVWSWVFSLREWEQGRFSSVLRQNTWAFDFNLGMLPNACLAVLLLTAFCALLIWSLILYDGYLPPRALYAFILVPSIARLIVQPGRIGFHLAAVLPALIVGWLIARCLAIPRGQAPFHISAGFASAGFLTGLQAILPMLALCLLVILIAFFLLRKNSYRSIANRMLRTAIPVTVLASMVLGLFF